MPDPSFRYATGQDGQGDASAGPVSYETMRGGGGGVGDGGGGVGDGGGQPDGTAEARIAFNVPTEVRQLRHHF